MRIFNFAATFLYLQSIFSQTSGAKDGLFEQNGLNIVPINRKDRNSVNQKKYSLEKCEEMKEKFPINVQFYSEDCDDLKNDHGDFLDINLKTLKKIVKAADQYWCGSQGDKKNCNFYINDSKKVSDYKVKVCAVESFARGSENIPAQSVGLEPNNVYRMVNNPDGSYRDIRVSLIKVDNVKRGLRGVKFDIDRPMKKIKSKSLLIEIFTHEVGHAVFGLDHPKSASPDTIMQPGRREEDVDKDYMPTTKEDDKKFISKCLLKESADDLSREL